MSKGKAETHPASEGFTVDSYNTEFCNVDWVRIQDENGVEAMGKPIGNYVTIETNILENGQRGNTVAIAKTVSEYLTKLMGISDNDSVLVVGVGNRKVISDSLGVHVAEKVHATRHIADHAIEKFGVKLRPVSVITPGVMGVTGISTAEIIRSICGEVKPDLVILIDALAAGKTVRLYSTIQMADTGLTPSAGLKGNVPRQTINQEFLGIPVVSIGVPTVINAATIIADIMNSFMQNHEDADNDSDMADMLENIQHLADEMFASSSSFVSTKEIDSVVHFAAQIISSAINMALLQEDLAEMAHNIYL